MDSGGVEDARCKDIIQTIATTDTFADYKTSSSSYGLTEKKIFFKRDNVE